MACQRCGGYHLSIEPCPGPLPSPLNIADPFGEKLLEEWEKDMEEDKDGRYR